MSFSFRLFLFVFLSANVLAIDTTKVQLREGSSNDGEVTITRQGGELLLDDTTTTLPISLATLVNSSTDHGSLTGLYEDDHPQYLNTIRHTSEHNPSYNDALAIAPDINGNVSLGSHAQDSEIHLSRSAPELITGAWEFSGSVDFTNGQLYLSNGGTVGPTSIMFEDNSGYAALTYYPNLSSLYFAQTILASGIDGNYIEGNEVVVSDYLRGDLDGTRSGVLSGFKTIEGIDYQDLLSRNRTETISSPWNFVTLHSTGSSWKDYSTLSSVGAFSGWTVDSGGLSTFDDGKIAYFPILYEEGSIIEAIRVKWQGQGLRVRLVKREESLTGTSFSIIGTEQVYGTAPSVTIATYTLPTAEPVLPNYSYTLEIESDVSFDPAYIFGWGIKTSQRSW